MNIINKILWVLLVLNITSGHSQNCVSNSKKNSMRKFDIKNFDKLRLDENHPKNQNDIYYKDGQESIRIVTSKKDIQVEKSNDYSPYKLIEIYSIKDSVLIREGKSFLYFPVGVWNDYDASGKLIKSKDYDEQFEFSVDNLIDKMNKEFKINILEKDRTLCYRYYDKDLNRSFYEVFHKITIEGEQLDCFLLDGNSGTLLYRKVQYQQDKNGSLYQQYINDVK